MAAPIFAFSAGLPLGGRAVHERYGPGQVGRHGYAGPLNSRLSGTGRVGDDLYLMAHDDVTGKPLLETRGLALGLAAACGLRFRIDQYLAPGRGIAEATRPLPADLRELIAQTQAAADSVLYRRV